MTVWIEEVDSDGVTRDTRSMDDAFWAANQVSFQATAKQYGYTLYPTTTQPPGGPFTPITTVVGFNSWVRVVDAGNSPIAAPDAAPATNWPAVIVVAGGVGAVAYWLLK